jgi:hypothetical protein
MIPNIKTAFVKAKPKMQAIKNAPKGVFYC